MGVGNVPQATFDRVGAVLTRALDGLSVDQLRMQPAGPESNPIGWLAWHLARVHDTSFSALLGVDQAWVADRWCAKLGLPPETGTGIRSTLDAVRAFDPVDAGTLLGYWEASRGQSRRVLDHLTEEQLSQPSPEGAGPGNETFTLTIARVTSDTSQHIGQIAYARGLVDKHGWYGA
jgi:hypothetical protein